jgi:alpha-L-rhamnosidase
MTFSNNTDWIWQNSNAQKNEYVQFIKDFQVDELKNIFEFKISSDTAYALWINEEFIDCGQLSDCESYKIYDVLDVTKFIKKGLNRLCILGYSHNESTFWYVKNIASIIFELTNNDKIIAFSDNSTLTRIAPDYYSGEMYKITEQLGYSFRYDNRKYDGWNTISFETNNFTKAVQVNNKSKLVEKPIKKLDILERVKTSIITQGIFKYEEKYDTVAKKIQNAFLSHKMINTLSNVDEQPVLPSNEGISFKYEESGIYLLIDLGHEDAGLFSIDIEAKEGTRIDIAFGEHIADLRVRTAIVGRNYMFEFICKEGRNRYTNHIKRFGLRYLQLFIHSNSFKIYYVGIHPTNYPINKMKFIIDDSLHQKIYDTSVRTLELCMHEHYEDCPWREQALYIMDSRNQMLCGYYAFGNFDYAKYCLTLLAKGIRKDNHLSMCFPTDEEQTIPSFTLAYYLSVYEYVIYSRDVDFIHEIYDVLESVMNVFINKIEDNGLINIFEGQQYWNFYEWSESMFGAKKFEKGEISYDAPLNAFLSIALDRFSKLNAFIDNDGKKEYYAGLADQMNKAIDANFWDTEKQAYATFIKDGKRSHYAELAQSLIVYCGAAVGRKANIVLDKLVKEDNELVPVTIAYSIFKYDALLLTNADKYSNYVFSKIENDWGYMLYHQATSFWETIRGSCDFGFQGSLCHGWSAIPIYFYCAYAIGVKPQGISRKYRLNPVMTRFNYVEFELFTPDGVLCYKLNENLKR